MPLTVGYDRMAFETLALQETAGNSVIYVENMRSDP
jgi:hypothetical protein